MSQYISKHVDWVGIIDWELQSFHGEELTTPKGSSYNSYLIKDEKTVLVDTVWKPHAKQFIQNLQKIIDIKRIDYIIINHAEIDHSGALPDLMKLIPNTPIYCTAAGEKILRGHYHEDWNFVTVKTKDKLDIGSCQLMFIEAAMLHWPDTMFVYMPTDKILFSNDAFGQHFASCARFASDENLPLVLESALSYYANILAPFSILVKKKIEELTNLQLAIDMILTSHGLSFQQKHVPIILDAYRMWSDRYQENQLTIVYDSMWESTKTIAEAIAKGVHHGDEEIKIQLFHAGKHDKNEILTEIFKSKAVLFGSSTVNNGLLHGIAGLLELMKGLKLKNKKAACFASYGWSGESLDLLNQIAAESGFELLHEGIRTKWAPDADFLQTAKQFGFDVSQRLKQKG